MSQVEEHTRSKCPTCGADRGEPCVTRDGRLAEKVHYGRPYWSGLVGQYRPGPTRKVSLPGPSVVFCADGPDAVCCPECGGATSPSSTRRTLRECLPCGKAWQWRVTP